MPKIIADVKENLIKTAEDLFIKQGYDAVNIRKIAKEAGIASGTVYNYFSSKEALYQAVLMDSWNKTMHILETLMDEKAPLDDKIKRFVKTVYLEVENRQGLGGRIILEERKKKASDAPNTEARLGEYMNKIQDMLAELLQEHPYIEKQIGAPKKLSRILLGSFWMLHRHYGGEVQGNLDFIERYLDTLLESRGDLNE